MKLQVPFVTQHDPSLEILDGATACGIACAKMIIDYYANTPLRPIFSSPASIEDLNTEGKLVLEDGLAKGIHGWTHDSIVALLHNHGVPAYREEFRSVHFDVETKSFSPSLYASSFLDSGVNKIIASLDAGNPVIVSGIKNWEIKEKKHMFVFTGYEKDEDASDNSIKGFYYHDPHTLMGQEDREHLFISLEDFKNKWRKFAIFAY